MGFAIKRLMFALGFVQVLWVIGAGSAMAAGASSFVDPHGRFALMVPPDAQIVDDPDKKFDVGIRSARKGFRVTVQTAPTNPQFDLAGLIGRFEAAYVGPSKQWSLKLGQRRGNVGRLPSFDGLYEGNRMRVRVVVARGRNTDFVFMLMAPLGGYEDAARDFDWILANFRPAATELGEQPRLQEGTVQEGMEAMVRAPAPAPPPSAPRRFADPGYGYTLDYPVDWVAIKASPTAVVFGGREGTEAFFATVSIQNVRPPEAEGPGEAVKMVLADLREQLDRDAHGIAHLGAGGFPYKRNGLSLEGQQFLVTYSSDREHFKQWTVVLPRNDAAIVHIWSYRAPERFFNLFRPIAEKMLRGWTLQSTRE
jgi:hypothetical protein